jgi:hypothetical protein
MKKIALLLCWLPLQLMAQTLGNFEPFEAGDTVVYSVTMNGAVKKLEYNYVTVDKNGAAGKVTYGDKEGEFKSSAPGLEEKDIALSNGQIFIRTPPIKIFEPGLQIGSKWNTVFEAKGETLTAQVIQQAQASKLEKVKLKFGEYDAILVTNNDVIQGINNKSEVFSGKSTAKIWVGIVNNRALILKREYQNSFGEKLVQELAELPKVSDVQKKLEKLKDLFKQGLINESEYELKRKELLKKL